MGDYSDNLPKLDDNPDLLKDKLREIIQTATGWCIIRFCSNFDAVTPKIFSENERSKYTDG